MPDCCYPNNCYPNNCYNPCNSSCYPNTQFLCAPPQPCTQTVFRKTTDFTVSLGGTVYTQGIASNDESCTDFTSIQINGSGLSIASICAGTESESGSVQGTTFNSEIAGNVPCVSNCFTTTILVQVLPVNGTDIDFSSVNGSQAVGCVSITVCGGMVVGQGSLKGVYNNNGTVETFTGSVVLSGCVCNSCGTRYINFKSLSVCSSP